MTRPSWIRYLASQAWNLVADRSTIAPIACALAIWIQFNCRVPGSFLFLLLPPVGVALLALSFYFLINRHLGRVRADDPFRLTLDRIEWWSSLLVRVFVYFSLLLFLNAVLDSSKPVYEPYEVVSIANKFDPGLSLSYSWVTLRHRDYREKTERILIKTDELRRLWGADPVAVIVRQGYLGILWIVSIERDWDYYGREILKLTPTASEVWKRLIDFDLALQRWKEAIAAAHKYFELYPNDYQQALIVGSELFFSFRYSDSVPFFEYAVARHPTYDAYQLFGTALSYAGNNPRAAKVLEASIPLNPDNYEAYYHLGYVYGGMGQFAEGIAMFGKALERRPNFPEVEIEINRLEQGLAAVEAAKQRRGRISKPSP